MQHRGSSLRGCSCSGESKACGSAQLAGDDEVDGLVCTVRLYDLNSVSAGGRDGLGARNSQLVVETSFELMTHHLG